MPNGATMDMNTTENGRANVTPSDTNREIANPQSNSQVYYGSFSSILMQNLGQYVVVEFLVGTNRLEIKEGILYSSGINFLSLYDPQEDRYIVCDLYAVKFVTFYNTTTVPPSRMGRIHQPPMTDNNMPQSLPQQGMYDFNNNQNTNYMQQGLGMNAMRGGMRGY